MYWVKTTTIKKNTEALSVASKEVALEVNAEKMSCHQKEGKTLHNKASKHILSKHGKVKKEVKISVKKDLKRL
jgi:hypothetical protein